MGGVIWWRNRGDSAPLPSDPVPTVHAQPAKPASLPDFAPPPPPPAESSAAPVASALGNGKSGKGGGAAPGSACSACGQGVSTAALNAAVQSRAATAQGCYNRALRQGGAEGKVTMSVSIGNDGSVCGVSVVKDSLGSAVTTSCIAGKLQGGVYPKPTEGCVVLQVPIVFKMR